MVIISVFNRKKNGLNRWTENELMNWRYGEFWGRARKSDHDLKGETTPASRPLQKERSHFKTRPKNLCELQASWTKSKRDILTPRSKRVTTGYTSPMF